MSLKIQCAWHPKFFGSSLTIQDAPTVMDEFGNAYEPFVSHSICPECEIKFAQENKSA